MDARLRELERRARSGDPEARDRFAREALRARGPLGVRGIGRTHRTLELALMAAARGQAVAIVAPTATMADDLAKRAWSMTDGHPPALQELLMDRLHFRAIWEMERELRGCGGVTVLFDHTVGEMATQGELEVLRFWVEQAAAIHPGLDLPQGVP